MAFCTNCGSPVADGAKFCTNCGAPLAPRPAAPAAQPQPQNPAGTAWQQPAAPQGYYPQQPYGQIPAKKKSRLPLILLLFVLGIALVGGAAYILMNLGSDSFTEPGTGEWEGVQAEMFGISMDIADVYPDGFSIVLKDGGKCSVTVGSKTSSGKWSLDGKNVSISAGGVDLSGTLSGNTLRLDDVMDSGVLLVFRKAGTSGNTIGFTTTEPVFTEPVFTEPAVSGLPDFADVRADWWNGEWYGWWAITEGTDGYAELTGNWWDCCADIEAYGDDTMYMCLWDEDCSRNEPISEINFILSEGDGFMGTAESEGGYFYSMEFGKGHLKLDPSVYNLENTIGIEGDYTDEDGSFHFRLYLRPWGQDWSDVDAEDYENIPYEAEDLYPFYYEDWYLPAIEDGISMPDTIGNSEE